MDSQEQYEALLRRWGLEDRSAERRARRQKIFALAKTAFSYSKKALSFNHKAAQQTQTSH